MKKFILITLSAMLAFGILVSLGIVAYANETTTASEAAGLPELPDDIGRLAASLEELGFDYNSVWNAFPEEIEQWYENELLYVTDQGFTNVTLWSYLNYETYQFTLVNGKWQVELPNDVKERGGIVYLYIGEWKAVTRGGTKESVLLDGDDKFGRPFMIEVMWNFFRIFSGRELDDNGYSVDAYYTLTGELDYLSVTSFVYDYQTSTYYNVQREATTVCLYYNGWIYMSPDGNWYSNQEFDSEICTAPPEIAEMSFEEIAALNPCFLDCGDHKYSEDFCESDQVCAVCHYVIKPSTGHSWDDGVVTTDPTCSAVGVKTYTCTHNREHTKTEDVAIDETAHAWDDGMVTTDPTCSAVGVKTYTCTHNTEHTKTEDVAIDETAHAWDDGVVTTDPTCSAVGVKTYTCTHNTEHTKTEDVAIDENAHTDGDNNGKCDACDKEISTVTPDLEPNPETGAEPGADDTNVGNNDNNGLETGAIVAIAAGSTVVGGAGIFALVWFVIKKKTWTDLLLIFKK